jgi:hypothetical protein
MALLALLAGPAVAENLPPVYTITGATGLVTVPDARFEPAGTLRASVAQANPYWHGTIGVQVAEPLWLGLRQTAWAARPGAEPQGFYPGLDAKIRLMREGGHRPALALGLQGAVGHRRMAGEYLVASKRFHDLDVTLGLGWGRFAGAAVAKNPLRLLGGHFDGPRSTGTDGADAARAADWFTGPDVGLLAGVAWHTPVPGLTLKADTSGQDWAPEAASSLIDPTYKDRPHWSIGADWSPPRAPWLNLGAGTLGGTVFAGRVTLATNVARWPVAPYKARPGPKLPHVPVPDFLAFWRGPGDESASLAVKNLGQKGPQARLAVALDPALPGPLQIGRAACTHLTTAPKEVRGVAVVPYVLSFRGPVLHLPRPALDKATQGRISPEELWHATTIDPTHALRPPPPKEKSRSALSALGGLFGETWHGPGHPARWRITLEGQGSLSAFDHGAPYRTSVVFARREHRPGKAMAGGMALRVNLVDNLTSALSGRPVYINPARSNVAAFADKVAVLEDAYTAWTHTFRPGVYGAVTTGYLEEMYMGTGAEVLWRPYASRFALGAEAWWLGKRSPETFLALGVDGGNGAVATGHVTLHYDLPEGWWGQDVALALSAGRYLAGDVGATLALRKGFRNGVTLRALATATNGHDIGPYGERLGAYAGLALEIPLGSVPYVPKGSTMRLVGAPLGRNAGQRLRKPLDIYEATRPLSLPRMAAEWGGVVEQAGGGGTTPPEPQI